LRRDINPSAGMYHPGKKATMSAHCQVVPGFIVACFYTCYQNGVGQTSELHQTDVT